MDRDTNVVGAQAEEMLDLLAKQAELCDALQGLARTQRSLVAAENTQPLMKLLAQRQRLTSELTGLQERLTPYRRRWQEMRAALPAARQQTAEELLGRVSGILQDVLASDENDARMLELRKRRAGSELESLDSCKQALAAYRGAEAGSVACFDRTHDES